MPDLEGMADDVHRHKRAKIEDDKPKKEQCRICYTDIDGPFLTPCLVCRKPFCNDCIQKQFEMALKDKERMPPRCCRRVFHHGVASGILSPTDMEIYKQRYEESVTPNPFYCPKQTCSAFIPPRNQKPIRGKVLCESCYTLSCLKCKQIADPANHTCVQSTETDEIIKQFGYKRCPKCHTAAMKMYGCPHVRCINCGAHFCYDCVRPINVCNIKPCARARDEGDRSEADEGDSLSDGDEGEESSSSVHAISGPTAVAQRASSSEPYLPQQALNTATQERATASETDIFRTSEAIAGLIALSRQSTLGPAQPESQATDRAVPATTSDPLDVIVPTTATELQPATPSRQVAPNLDDPHRLDMDWENPDEFDFGDEPTDEEWDIWGCLHRFNVLTMARIPDQWQNGLDKSKSVQVECMGCFKEMKIQKAKEDVMPDIGSSNSASDSKQEPATDVAISSGSEPVKEVNVVDVKKAKEDKKKAVYDCADCGVILCFWCRRIALRRAEKYRQEAGLEAERIGAE